MSTDKEAIKMCKLNHLGRRISRIKRCLDCNRVLKNPKKNSKRCSRCDIQSRRLKIKIKRNGEKK